MMARCPKCKGELSLEDVGSILAAFRLTPGDFADLRCLGSIEQEAVTKAMKILHAIIANGTTIAIT